MKPIKYLPLLMIFLLVLVACGSADPTPTPMAEPVEEPTEATPEEPTPTFESAEVPEGTTPFDTMEFEVDPNLVDVTWEWFQRTTTQATEVLFEVPNPDKYTVFFNADQTFNAQLDCNGGSGAYTTDGAGNLFMQLGPMTAAACPPESLSNEMVNMFGPAQSYVYEDDGNTVIFKFAAGGPWDYYRKVGTGAERAAGTGGSLTGVIWNLTELNGEPPLPATAITAEFSDDGQVTGSSGCNNYTAAYEVDGKNININMVPIATTLMACLPPVMDQEAAYMEALGSAESYEASQEELLLFDAEGNPVAIFAAVSQDLSGSSWDVISYNNGRGGVTSLIIGTEITANFGEDGELAGNAGCNDYFGAYEADEENISMGPFGSTRKACQEPEGIMQQEAEYLAALETASTYKIDGLTMNIRTAEGATVANFSRVISEGASVTGEVTYAQRIALPEDAVVMVQIQDTSLADAPAKVIGEQVIETDGRQVPIPYSVSYDPGVIDERFTYTMSARITDGAGNLLWINDTSIPVITQGNPTEGVVIPVVQAGG